MRWVMTMLAAVVSVGPASADRTVFPREHWERAQPDAQGVDPAALEEAVAYLEAHSGRDGVRELMIVRNGYIIWQGDRVDKIHGIWSCTKSFTSTCLGLLIDDGKCALDAPAKDFLPALARDYPAVTLRHFATMTSGYRALGDEPLLDVIAKRERDERRGGADQVAGLVRPAAGRDAVHDEVLVVGRNAAAVLLRLTLGGLAKRPQKVGVAAAERFAYRRVRREDVAVLEVLGRGVDVGLRPGVRLREFHDAVLDQQIEHLRPAIVPPRTEVARPRGRVHREHPLPLPLGGVAEDGVRRGQGPQPQVNVLLEGQSNSHSRISSRPMNLAGEHHARPLCYFRRRAEFVKRT